jgi:glycosyltransferase involved in cell wall biosynthesis
LLENRVKKRVILASNSSWNLFNFRYPIIKKLLSNDYEVIVCGEKDDATIKLIKLGCSFVNLKINSNGKSPVQDFYLFLCFIYIFFREKPDLFMPFTVKPNIYGGMAAHLFNIPVINTVTGLGSAFLQENFVKRLICWMYKMSLKQSKVIFFQNPDDLDFFISTKLAREDVCFLTPGSGVNIKEFVYTPILSAEPFRFLFVGRLLRDKGILEYMQSAKLIKAKFDKVTFAILGPYIENNPNSVPVGYVKQLIQDGVVEYYGYTENVLDYLMSAHCVVLPSYREGVPKALLEASAIGRPMIATDVPGCREVVDHVINGYLCKPKDVLDLADKMQMMLANSTAKLNEMGLNARRKVEDHFDENLVAETYMKHMRIYLRTGFGN